GAIPSLFAGRRQRAVLADVRSRVEDANFRALDGGRWSSLDAPGPLHKLEAWVAYDYGHSDFQAGPNSGSGHGNTIALGGDMKLSERMLVGMMFGYTDARGDFGGEGGGYTLK